PAAAPTGRLHRGGDPRLLRRSRRRRRDGCSQSALAAGRPAKRAVEVFALPGRVEVHAAEVTVRGELAVELSAVAFGQRTQAERVHDRGGPEIDHALDRALDALVG